MHAKNTKKKGSSAPSWRRWEYKGILDPVTRETAHREDTRSKKNPSIHPIHDDTYVKRRFRHSRGKREIPDPVILSSKENTSLSFNDFSFDSKTKKKVDNRRAMLRGLRAREALYRKHSG